LVIGIALVVVAFAACRRGGQTALLIEPQAQAMLPKVPSDPFGTPGAAYDQLRQITDEARTTNWNGDVEELSSWLERETMAVEQSLALMKALRLGAGDAYAVANGRMALVYEHIAATLTEAEVVVKDRDLDFDWIGQQAKLWEQANGFWTRCARGCSLGGAYLDVWELRCQAGIEETADKLGP
jgi:hypothetical protein